jgi:hypothetical protein
LPASLTFEIGPHVGGVLISEIAVGLEAFRDDSLQLRRPLDAQPDARRGPLSGVEVRSSRGFRLQAEVGNWRRSSR